MASPGVVVVNTMVGENVATFDEVPATVEDLKQLLEERSGISAVLQQLLTESGEPAQDDEALQAGEHTFILVHDDRPQYFWDQKGNPAGDQIVVNENIVTCERLRSDYCNVLTQQPIVTGMHYFEFHLHNYQDEQWCGLVQDKKMVGKASDVAVPSKQGWMYYTGRRKGAIEAQGRHLKEAEFVPREDSVLGMLVDCDEGAVAWDLNGKPQGACEIPKQTPLWLLTHVDTPSDHVELRKVSLETAPPAHFDALKNSLLELSEGKVMNRTY
eukprot:TRINITY_DN33564_c0_g1_i1.p2 TRINITY_DN33564_c0_g1~~TRINITY_DN33564_c0_g1_i1.p2  ORF type:complete len:270 (+),score=59.22 TRINITY_DN33564_c0_g1_i1:123-932(+)